MSRKAIPWIVVGGRLGEYAHCTRCGVGLELSATKQTINVVLGALDGFQKDHEHCKEGADPNPEVVTRDNWPRSRDTGVSSWTIYSVMRGMDSPHARYSPPQDPADFGRCYRLLNLFPEWRERLKEVAAKFPEWRKLVRKWSALEETFAVLKDDDDRSTFYLALRDLIEESATRK